MADPVLRIGTRDSELAVWQARKVAAELSMHGHASELIYIKSEGDINLTTPLYEMGVQGIFTRSLDIALLENRIDLAVHSMKDIPTRLPEGLALPSVLERANALDVCVLKKPSGKEEGKKIDQLREILYQLNEVPSATITVESPFIIASSSARRRAQWLYHFPGTDLQNLRGNINTRLKKLSESNWQGAIFAAAGLERIGLRDEQAIDLKWMLPAPSQGAIAIVTREDDQQTKEACLSLLHQPTAKCTMVEKDFLRRLMGGCTKPISAYAKIEGESIQFEGSILSHDGQQQARIYKVISANQWNTAGTLLAEELLQNGGQALLDQMNEAV